MTLKQSIWQAVFAAEYKLRAAPLERGEAYWKEVRIAFFRANEVTKFADEPLNSELIPQEDQ
jgi:hypothetical protein